MPATKLATKREGSGGDTFFSCLAWHENTHIKQIHRDSWVASASLGVFVFAACRDHSVVDGQTPCDKTAKH